MRPMMAVEEERPHTSRQELFGACAGSDAICRVVRLCAHQPTTVKGIIKKKNNRTFLLYEAVIIWFIWIKKNNSKKQFYLFLVPFKSCVWRFYQQTHCRELNGVNTGGLLCYTKRYRLAFHSLILLDLS